MNYTRCIICVRKLKVRICDDLFLTTKNTSMVQEAYQTFIDDWVARARVRCAWAKFKELSSILTVRGASYHIKGKINRACVQIMLTYGVETWSTKAENLHSLQSVQYDGEMCGWSIVEGQKTQCGFVQPGSDYLQCPAFDFSKCSECGRCGEAWQIEVVWTGIWGVKLWIIGCRLL